MAKISTHYDNLQVPRNAPADAIRAAYRHLARRYHPDRNSDSAESHRLMQALNDSFAVLDDPRSRAEHDQWIAVHEKDFFGPLKAFVSTVRARAALFCQRAASALSVERHRSRWREFVSAWVAPAGLMAILLWGLSFAFPWFKSVLPSLGASRREVSPPAAPAYERPRTAPNGTPWPRNAAEISGYPVDRNDGKSEVTVENSRNAADVFVTLVSVDGSAVAPVRHFYIPGRQTYQCKNVRPGKYEVWYQDLSTGSLKRSAPFELAETSTDGTVNFSIMRIILYKVADGNGLPFPTVDSEF